MAVDSNEDPQFTLLMRNEILTTLMLILQSRADFSLENGSSMFLKSVTNERFRKSDLFYVHRIKFTE